MRRFPRPPPPRAEHQEGGGAVRPPLVASIPSGLLPLSSLWRECACLKVPFLPFPPPAFPGSSCVACPPNECHAVDPVRGRHLRASPASSLDRRPGTGARGISALAQRPGAACWCPQASPFHPGCLDREPRSSLWPAVFPLSPLCSVTLPCCLCLGVVGSGAAWLEGAAVSNLFLHFASFSLLVSPPPLPLCAHCLSLRSSWGHIQYSFRPPR